MNRRHSYIELLWAAVLFLAILALLPIPRLDQHMTALELRAQHLTRRQAMSQARHTSTRRPPTTIPVAPKAHDTELVDSMDDLLQEIDDLLEQEDEFLLRFRQKGGQ